MAKRTCSIDGCEKDVHGHGWCSTHYHTWRRQGDPEHWDRLRLTPEQRFWSKVRKADGYGCWEWTGTKSGGSGRIWWEKTIVPAYRVSYTLVKGPIPEGLHIDHLCRNPICVNPDHLEPVTQRENTLRGIGPTAINARKTHCKRGHELGGENLIPGDHGRECRKCASINAAERYKARKRAEMVA